jgi:hypothetical protein
VSLRWHMNLYLHYGIGRKQSVLKSNDQTKSNPQSNLSNTRKTPKAENYHRRKPPPEMTCVTHVPPPNDPLQ